MLGLAARTRKPIAGFAGGPEDHAQVMETLRNLPVPVQNEMPPSAQPRLGDGLPRQPAQVDPSVLAMVGDKPKKTEDRRRILSGLITAAGVISARTSGNDALGYSIARNYHDQLQSSRDAYNNQMQGYQDRMRVASLPGMTAREMAAYVANPKSWGTNMSDALSSHHAAANVGQTETRVFGNPNAGGSVYQPPRLIENGTDQLRYNPMTGNTSTAVQGMTPGEQYARSLGLQPGTASWFAALKDQMLRGSGPTAFGYDVALDDHRTQNDRSVEGLRQRNRVELRGVPTYGQTNPAPRTVRENIPTVSTPADARRLPKGTKFKTPDGRVKIAR
ncbi:hypothetical protein GCM10011371_21790 [Novosphingobium marinum]|nr:hypothetical protein GCM10011371_21790 [Novosphingobium marinum]